MIPSILKIEMSSCWPIYRFTSSPICLQACTYRCWLILSVWLDASQIIASLELYLPSHKQSCVQTLICLWDRQWSLERFLLSVIPDTLLRKGSFLLNVHKNYPAVDWWCSHRLILPSSLLTLRFKTSVKSLADENWMKNANLWLGIIRWLFSVLAVSL